MKLNGCQLLVGVALLFTLSACEQKSNRTDGIKDAFDARPNEEIRDAGEEVGEAVKDAGGDIKDAIKGN